MSPRPSRVSEHLQRLDDEGYELDVRDDGHLVISHIPYVDSTKAVRFGVLAYPGDELSPPIDHTIWWAGDAPCDRHGTPLNLGNYAEVHYIIPDSWHVLTEPFAFDDVPGVSRASSHGSICALSVNAQEPRVGRARTVGSAAPICARRIRECATRYVVTSSITQFASIDSHL